MDYQIHDEELDREHRQIFELFDAFARLPETGSRAKADTLLTKLKKQIIVHLVHEEIALEKKYQVSAEYLREQKEAHEQLREAVMDKIDILRNSESPALRDDVRAIREWIERHIREVDSRLGDATM